MKELLTQEQLLQYEAFTAFAEEHIQPYAADWEAKERIPQEAIRRYAAAGYLGGMMPAAYGGRQWDCVTYGLFTEAVARASTSFSGVFNVHTMVMQSILKWGTEVQKERWLGKMARGEALSAFALTEPGAGSDVKGIATTLSRDGEELVLNGTKRWITCGGLADVYLVFGKLDDEKGSDVACLVERSNAGLHVEPIHGMLGFRASELATLTFHQCRVSVSSVIGKPGFAFSHIAPYALDYGRLSVAFAALGILHGSLQYASGHVLRRKTFASLLIEQSTVKEMLTRMAIDYEAAAMLCMGAARSKDEQHPSGQEKMMKAKYYTTRACREHAASAVQLLGAAGCHGDHPVSRYYRDCKTMEIIEGSNQIIEMLLAPTIARKYRETHKTRKTLEATR